MKKKLKSKRNKSNDKLLLEALRMIVVLEERIRSLESRVAKQGYTVVTHQPYTVGELF